MNLKEQIRSTSFSNKAIRLSITLGKGAFAEGATTKIIEGLACDVSVRKSGVPDKNEARVKVWGLSYEGMAQLTMLAFKTLESRHNLISIQDGEKGGPAVFSTGIVNESGGIANTGGVSNSGGALRSTGVTPETHNHTGMLSGDGGITDMDSKLTKSWRDITLILVKDPNITVRCPTCNNSFLEVIDSYISPDSHFERLLYCKACGDGASIRMSTDTGKDG